MATHGEQTYCLTDSTNEGAIGPFRFMDVPGYYIPSKDAPPGTSNRSIAVPCIYFKGRWLEQAGFKIGSMVKIRVRPGRLILTNK
jgi:hypothetical protein